MKRNTLILLLISGLVLISIVLIYFHIHENEDNKTYIHNEGTAQGTTYSITYEQPNGIDLQDKIEKRLQEFDLTFSTYIP